MTNSTIQNSGNQGISLDENSVLLFLDSTIQNNAGVGMVVTGARATIGGTITGNGSAGIVVDGGYLQSSTTVTNNVANGIILSNLSVGHISGTISGNSSPDLYCDKTSVAYGDFTLVEKNGCKGSK